MIRRTFRGLFGGNTREGGWALPTRWQWWLGIVFGLFSVFAYFFPQEYFLRSTKDPFVETKVGMNFATYKKIFGEPVFTSSDEAGKYSKHIYKLDQYVFCLMTNLKNQVVFYSYGLMPQGVGGRRPVVPPFNKLIFGNFTFDQYSSGVGAQPLFGAISSKDYTYYEKVYFGNPGNYLNYYLGYYSRSIHDFDGKEGAPGFQVDEVTHRPDDEKNYEEFHKTWTPNIFGVGNDEADQALAYFGIFPNYTEIDQLP